MSAAPEIHAYGLCNPHCNHDAPNAEQVAVCREWLRRWAYPRKTINTRRGSYGLKHEVERSTEERGVTHLQTDHLGRRWGGSYVYVSNGSFIEAARLEGYRFVQAGWASPNAYFNMGFRKVPLEIEAPPGAHAVDPPPGIQ